MAQNLAPNTLLVQTNLTGSVTDIDESPDSPDANWLTASGASTLRCGFPTPTLPPLGLGQQIRAWVRKSAVGGGTGTLYPDGTVFTVTGYGSGTVDDVDEAEDGTWLTPSATNPTLHASFGNPGGDLKTGTGLQTFRVYAKKDTSGGGTPQMNIQVRETGSATVLASTGLQDVTSETGQAYTLDWDATVLGTADGSAVEIFVDTRKGGGGGNQRDVSIDSIRWEYETGAETITANMQLYENGVARGSSTPASITSTTGEMITLSFDAALLTTADGSDVEFYLIQTGSPGVYLEVGAVEWSSIQGSSGFLTLGNSKDGMSVFAETQKYGNEAFLAEWGANKVFLVDDESNPTKVQNLRFGFGISDSTDGSAEAAAAYLAILYAPNYVGTVSLPPCDPVIRAYQHLLVR
jgi:hypothetical protein